MAILAFAGFGTIPLAAQSDWHGWESAGGAALGAASGAVVGSLGSLLPCTDTYAGPHCVRWVAAAGALVGGVSGALVGGRDPARLGTMATSAGFGFAAGTIVGVAMTPFIERWAPEDALALGLIGGAAGSAPLGAAIGFGVGAVSGAVLWGTAPGFGSPRAAAFVLGGISVGVLAEWVVQALAAGDDGGPITIGFHVPF
jgi:hypothetical protein